MRWGGPGPHEEHRADTVTLTLDAVFFTTGECVGPDTKQLWDRIVAAAELHQEVAAASRNGVEAAFGVERILAEVAQITGDAGHAPPTPDSAAGPVRFREYECWSLAKRISHMRTHFGNDKTVSILRDWAEAAIPQHRRL